MSRNFFLFLFVALGLTACATPAAPATGGTTSTSPRVYFTAPADGTEVTSPVKVSMAAENFTVEPVDNGINAGAGHLHIMVDADCIAAGQVIPKDDTHLHYGGGQVEAELELAPGSHTLCLQAADGAHIALEGTGFQQTISVTVK